MTLKKAKCLTSHLSDLPELGYEFRNGERGGKIFKDAIYYLPGTYVPDVCSHILIIIRAFYNSDARENSSLENFYVVCTSTHSIVHCNQSKDAKTD